MKALMATTLIILGVIWLFYAMMLPLAIRTRCLSDAVAMEAKLKTWATEKIVNKKLNEEDVAEIFVDGYSLRIGGEDPNKNFREMVQDIANSKGPPGWLGVLAIIIGFLGAVYPGRKSQSK